MANSKKKSKRVARRKRFVKRVFASIAITMIMMMLGFAAYHIMSRPANAATIETEDGIRLADYWVEPLEDGTDRCILHVETYNDDFQILACEISCSPDFNDSEIHTFGALAQSGETSYTNEVVTLGAGDVLYIRALAENNIYTPVYTIELPAEEVETETETEPEKKTSTPKKETEKTVVTEKTAVPAVSQEKKEEKEQTTQKAQTAVVTQKETTDQKNTSTVINKTVVNEKIVNKTVVDETPSKGTGSVYVAYVSENGDVLGSETITGTVGDAYKTTQQDFPGYVFVKSEGVTSGKISAGVKTVKYLYKKQASVSVDKTGSVQVKYICNGTVLCTETITGTAGAEYTTEEKAFDGYVFVGVEGQTNGRIPEGTSTVVYQYDVEATEDPTPVEGIVTVSYESEDGQNLGTETITGTVGTEYTTEEKAFDGYVFVRVEGQTSGVIVSDGTTVKYIYAAETPSEDPTPVEGIVTVSYESEDGQNLGTETITGTVGTEYTTEEKAFDGYVFVRVEGQTSGVIDYNATTVKYIYAAETPVEHQHDYKVVSHAEAKCLTDGYNEYACSCGESYTEIIPAHGHHMEVYSVTEECIESHCMECGYVDMVYSEVVVEDEVVDETVVIDEPETEIVEIITEMEPETEMYEESVDGDLEN